MTTGAPRLCVVGARGRMGMQVLALAKDAGFAVTAAIDREAGGSAEGVAVTTDVAAAMDHADVYIDFSAPAATEAAARAAAKHGVAAVIGTTGLSAAATDALTALETRAPVLLAPNFSLGVNLMLVLAEQAARALGADYDLEVVELHHRRKRDAPSGTAIAVAQALATGRGVDYDKSHRYAREGDVGAREDDEIGVVAVRGGDIVGEHTAYLIGELERIEITHRAQSRSLFADGALRTARWLAGKPPGRYQMRDVLGLS